MVRRNIQYQSTGPRLGYIGVLVLLLGWFLFATPAAAVLTIQSISGSVEVLLSGEQAWQPLTAEMKLQAGDQVQTGADGIVELWFEDGSVITLAKETRLGISELEISMPQKTRIARFKLEWGTITVKVTKFAFAESVCEVETNVIVAGAKFSEMSVSAPRDLSQTDVIIHQGPVEIRQIADGIVNVSGLVDDQEGVAFLLNSVGASVQIETQKIIRKVLLQSNVPLNNVRALIGYIDNILKIENVGSVKVTLIFQGITAILEQQDVVTFGIPNEQELSLDIEQPDVALWFKQRPTIPCFEGLYVFVDSGSVNVNGQTFTANSVNCIPIAVAEIKRRVLPTEEEPAPRTLGLPEEKEEKPPVVPPAPRSEPPGGPDWVTPTPMPLPTPTPTPTPKPKATPTLTLTPTPTPTLPPAPTRTPISPIQP